MTKDSDAMLVDATLRGNPSAFGELVTRYQGVIFNAAYRITGSLDDAMDVTQATFVNAYEKLVTFDPSQRFFSWLYRIGVNQALNLVHRKQPNSELKEAVQGTPSGNPETSAQQTELGVTLAEALLQLNPTARAMVFLKHVEGYSYREIAAVVGIPEKTVKSRLFSARRKLREIIMAEGSPK